MKKRESSDRAAVVLCTLGAALLGVSAAYLDVTMNGITTVLQPEPAAGDAWLPGMDISRSFRLPAALQRDATNAMSAVVASVLLSGALIALIAFCTLVLTGFSRRRQELAARAALGATPAELLREIATPIAQLVGLGFLFGLASAAVIGGVVGAVWPGVIEAGWTRRLLDQLLGAAAFASVCGLFTIGSIWGLAVRGNLARVLGAGGRATAPASETRFREAFTLLQIASCVALLGAAVALSQSQTRAEKRPSLRSLIVARLEEDAAPGAQRIRTEALATLLRELQATPGVSAESIASAGAVVGLGAEERLYSECDVCTRMQPPLPFQLLTLRVYAVGPRFFELTGVRVLRGREFTMQDRTDAAPVVIVNRTFERLNFATGSAIGRIIRLRSGFGEEHRVVGVVEDRAGLAVGSPGRLTARVYFPALQYAPRHVEVLVRTTSEGTNRENLPPALQSRTAQVWRGSELRAAAVAPIRFMSLSTSALALLGLLIATFGLYATTGGTISAARREIAVRAAVGGNARAIVREFVVSGMKLVAAGCALGALGGFTAQRLLAEALPTATPSLGILAATTLLLCSATLAAVLPPALRGGRIPPAAALVE